MGPGISVGQLRTVFDMFVQGDPSHPEGIGIGLALVQALDEAHGGSVSAQSEGAGRGSAFTVRLPAADDIR